MQNINLQIDGLAGFPTILESLIDQIPANKYSLRRTPDEWNIIGQVMHLGKAQEVLTGRFKQFELEEQPHIKSYKPRMESHAEKATPEELKILLGNFSNRRKDLVNMLKGYDQDYWKKTGSHDIFTPYNSKLLLIHALNVDYAHLFNIEQLGLTRNEEVKY